ncbi:TPA: hypothetical protein N0F65_005780 [Lagenidium giganteum]|uniref:Uncharacterized protein n=1 Tax=Lagenidium giganteum TaxID=4803 RepID=A0AAV2YQ45_9STRA|nr:TPA: hypothetical protein N0F65_005780 [Lagenidium giganteum]
MESGFQTRDKYGQPITHHLTTTTAISRALVSNASLSTSQKRPVDMDTK